LQVLLQDQQLCYQIQVDPQNLLQMPGKNNKCLLMLMSFFISWYLFDEIIIAAIIGLVAHFISMGFSIKLAKKLSKEQQS